MEKNVLRGIDYSKEQLSFIRKNCNVQRSELAELFNKKFGTNKSAMAISSLCQRNGWNRDKENWYFKKGNVPFNKGLRGYMGANKTSFKKGRISEKYLPVGSESVTKEGYITEKIKDPSVWKLKHHHNWEQKNGKIPKGHCIVFIDGNKQNCEISNLRLITRGEHVQFNKNGYSNYPIECRTTLRNIVKLELFTNEMEKK